MKPISVHLLIAYCCMSIPSALFAATITQRAGMQDLIKELEKGTIKSGDIWGKIKKLNISPKDYNDPEFKRLNALAISKLNDDGFKIKNNAIPTKTNLAALSANERPTKGGSIEVDLETPIFDVGPKPKPGVQPVKPGVPPAPKPADWEPFGEEEEEEPAPLIPAPATEDKEVLDTLKAALAELNDLKVEVQDVNTLADLNDIQDRFNKYQDRYAGLSGVPVTAGKFLWRKIITPSEQSQFATAAQEALKAIREKELKLLGENPATNPMTPAEQKAYLEEAGKTNIYDAYYNKKLTKKQYEEIIKTRGELLKWQRRKFRGAINTGDVAAIKEVLGTVAALPREYVGEHSLKLANELKEYISSPESLKQATLLVEETGKVSTVNQELDKLNTEINAAINGLSADRITKLDFKSKFGKIDADIQSIVSTTDKQNVEKKARQTFLLFGRYIGMVAAAKSSIFTALNKKWENWWKKPDLTNAAEIDKALEVVKQLNADYKSFTRYMNATETEASVLLKNQMADASQFEKVLTRASQPERLKAVEVLRLELRDELYRLYASLARGKISALENFQRYKNFMEVAQKPGMLSANDLVEVTALWNDLQSMYAQYLVKALEQYRELNDLSHLHELATGQTVNTAKGIKEMLPEGPLNAISTMLSDLGSYLKSKEGMPSGTAVAKEAIDNLCFILAAFDGFTYALLTGSIEPDKMNGWFTWFWRLLGYQTANFKEKNQRLVTDYLNTIVRAISIYEKQILVRLAEFTLSNAVKKYNDRALNILESLGESVAQKANLYKQNTKEYRYRFEATSTITLAGGKTVTAIVEDITPIHKKQNEYRALVSQYEAVVAGAYEDAKWLAASKTQTLWNQMQEIARRHQQEVDSARSQITQLEQQIQNAATIEQITQLKGQLKKAVDEYTSTIKTLQDEYDRRKSEGN